MKVCHFCGNINFKKIKVTYSYKHQGKYLFINNVPCEQREYCGEQYFSAKVLKQIENEFNNIYLQGKKVHKEIIVPIENYKEFASSSYLE